MYAERNVRPVYFGPIALIDYCEVLSLASSDSFVLYHKILDGFNYGYR